MLEINQEIMTPDSLAPLVLSLQKFNILISAYEDS